MMQLIKRVWAFFLCLMLLTVPNVLYAEAAPDWPANVSVQAEAGIVIDADTGTVLWGQNIHSQYYPASITKIMTALLVIETCDLDDVVTFSHNAVFNVETDSSNAEINEGDKLSVKDCLYALLLKSANEAGNALAEHVAGSNEAFAELMNAKAKELGCLNTHFSNPSGLNDPEHYTSAYDMALISKAAFSNPVFEEIDSTAYYKLPPNSTHPEGLTIYPGHRMMKKSTPYYYPGVIGGKTGYTRIAGNTLVTCAEKNDMKLITVILKGKTPQYWTDTKRMLDFGFENFVSLKAADYETSYSSVTDDLNFDGLALNKPEALVLNPDSRIIIPKNAKFTDADPELSYDISAGDPEHAVAKINYRYNDRVIGCTFLEINEELLQPKPAVKTELPVPAAGLSGETLAGETLSGEILSGETEGGSGEADTFSAPGSEDAETEAETEDYREKALRPFKIPMTAWLILIGVAAIVIIGGLIVFLIYKKEKEQEEYLIRREERLRRLKESGVSADEFQALVERKKSSYIAKKKKGANKKGGRKF